MKFDPYKYAAWGNSAYIENLLLLNPDFINEVWSGEDADGTYFIGDLTDKLNSVNGYGLERLGVKGDWNIRLRESLAALELMVVLPWAIMAWSPALAVAWVGAASFDLECSKDFSKMRKGWSLLDFAVENNQIEVAVFLILKGASFDPKRLFNILKTNCPSRRFLILFTLAIKIRAENERLKNDNTILRRDYEEVLRYAEILFQEYEKRHTQFNITDSWYADEHINALLKFYFPITQNDIRALPPLEWNPDNSDTHGFIQTRFTNAIGYYPDCFIYFLPLEINKNHWIGLYVDRTPEAECVWWIDPMGGMTEAWKSKILEILNDAQIFTTDIDATYVHVQAVRLQHDTYNCGPWVIELLRFFTVNKHFPAAGEIDIGVKRQEHLAILNRNQPTVTTQLQGVSGQLSTFGIFVDQTPAAVVGKKVPINSSHEARL